MTNIKNETTINEEITTAHQPPTQNQTPASELDWHSIINDWEQSGKTQRAYCIERNIKLHLFTYYRNKICQLAKRKKRIAPVTVTEPPPQPIIDRYQLKLPSGTILSIPTHFEESSLQNLLSLLGVIS